MKVNQLHFIRLQFLNGHILVPHTRKTREYVFHDECVMLRCLLSKMVPDQSVTLGLWTSSTEQLYTRPTHSDSFMPFFSQLYRAFLIHPIFYYSNQCTIILL